MKTSSIVNGFKNEKTAEDELSKIFYSCDPINSLCSYSKQMYETEDTTKKQKWQEIWVKV